MPLSQSNQVARHVRDFVLAGFRPHYGELQDKFRSEPQWRAFRDLGTELWLDTGDMDEAGQLWCREFTALTTNNTLLNQQVQKGQYDDLIVSAARMLSDLGLDEEQIVFETAFILNARHALKLVERFDAYVSVEEHTDLANDLPASVAYARRYHDICPERFFVKIPFTPAGLLATRYLSREGIAINHTLGFSARQNYVIARIGQPQFVNVFLGRLNSVIVDNKLGDGRLVGEKATLASQLAVRHLRETRQIRTLQIGASFRESPQILSLAGIDIMTMPPKVARGLLGMNVPPEDIHDRTGDHYELQFDKWIDPDALGIDSLWEISTDLIECADRLEEENLDSFTPDDLALFFTEHSCGDFFPRWTPQQRDRSFAEGKIPRVNNWRDALHSGQCAMDSLMNLAGLSSFKADQKAMDDRVRDVISAKAAHM
jgi:transaldolase